MASWKKVIVSGSNANLTQLQVDNLTSGQVVIGGGASNLSTTAINGTGTIVATTGASGLSHSGSFSGSFQGSIIGGNAFIQGGNSFGTAATLGTNDNQSLNFETNGSVRMVVSSSGDVGIGTLTPRVALDVTNGTIFSGEIWTTNGFFLGDLDAGASNAYMTGHGGNTNSYLDFSTNATSRLQIGTNGNVGINKYIPFQTASTINAKLDVNGNAIITGSLIVTAGITGSLLGTASYASVKTSGSSLYSADPLTYDFNTSASIILGVNAGAGLDENGQNRADNSVSIGTNAGSGSAWAYNAVNVGYKAGVYDESLLIAAGVPTASDGYSGNGDTVAIGTNAGINTHASTNNVYIGSNSGYNAYNTGWSVFIGDQAGQNAYLSDNAVAIGYQALDGVPSGSTSIAIGDRALQTAVKAGSTVAIGSLTGKSTINVDNSVFVGRNAGQLATFATASVFIGYGAGLNARNGSTSIFIGRTAGGNPFSNTNTPGPNNIIIGNNITVPSGSSRQLNIAGLIFGTGVYATTNEFSTTSGSSAGGRIGILKTDPNATLDVSGSAIISGSLIVTAGITGSLLGTASTSSFVTASGVFGPYGANSVISASYAVQSAASLGTLTFGEGLTAGTYNGSGNVTLTVSGAAQLTDNAITKWNNTDNKFVVSSLTDNGTTVTGASSIQLTGAASALTGSFTGSFKGDGSQLTGLVTALDISGSNGSGISVNLLTQDLTITGTANEIETSAAGTTVTIGLPNDVTIGNNLTVTGDLYVSGTTTTVNTADLYIEDKFILLASGSANAGDGGIIIDRGSDSDQNIAYGYDSTTDRWGFQNGITDSSNALNPTSGNGVNGAFVGYVFTEAAHTSTKPTTGEFVVPGAIYTNTDGTIWMYA